MSTVDCPALLMAAPASGQGKTTVTAALARYHTGQGRRVRVFKVGPDFIDPGLLEAASGHPVYQLDLWMAGEEACRRMLYDAACSADLILIEGVMGLFDGSPSAADLAERLGLPVMVLIDAQGMAETFAALALGLVSYRPSLSIYGVVANRVGSNSHAERLARSLPDTVMYRGAFPRQVGAMFPARHLGLVQAADLDDLHRRLETLASAIPGTGLEAMPPPVEFSPVAPSNLPLALQGVRIGIALDSAFSFVYPANIDLLRRSGADIVFFSPIRDAGLPEVDSLYLPGGYPELHLPALAGNTRLLDSIRQHVASGKPVLAECGGMLYLMETLQDAQGQHASLCGVLPGKVTVRDRLAGLGMQSATFPAGTLRGHTFHYSTLETALSPAFRAIKRSGGEGEAVYQSGRVTASYLHWYFPSCPGAVVDLLRP